jgi:lipopolysaccharide transport system permease protein
VFTIIFGRVAKLPSGGAPYTLLVLTGLLPWQFFSQAVASSAASLLSSSGLVSKVYFPRLLIPAAATATALVDFAVAGILMAGVMVYYRFLPDLRIFMLPAFLVLGLAAAAGMGLWFAALTVKYRDFRFVVPFVLQLGLFISPVGFGSGIVSERYRLLYSVNPMVSVIDGFRWCLLRGNQQLYWSGLAVSIAVATVCLVTGARYFRTTERHIADIL